MCDWLSQYELEAEIARQEELELRSVTAFIRDEDPGDENDTKEDTDA